MIVASPSKLSWEAVCPTWCNPQLESGAGCCWAAVAPFRHVSHPPARPDWIPWVGGLGEVRTFLLQQRCIPSFFLSCTRNIAFSTLLGPDGPAGAGVGVGAHAQNIPIKDDVHSVTKHFWESNVAQGNENECRFNQILFYMTLPLLISCVCNRMCPSLFGNF